MMTKNHLAAALASFGILTVARPLQGAEFAGVHPVSGVIHRWVGLPASLAPNQSVQLHARVAGYVKMISADKGDLVKAGQVLATIEVPELEADRIRAKAEQDAAEVEWKRLREARSKSPDLVLPQTVDNAEARYLQAKSALSRCLTLVDFAQIRAPFDGTVVSRSVDPGAFVSIGGTPLFRLVDAAKMRCQVPVTELETPLVAVGKPVKVLVDALGAPALDGRISRMSGLLDPQTRTMLVEADLENAGGKLIAGMSATAQIGVDRHDHAILIPVAGLVMEKTNAFVFKFVGGKAVKTAVKLGFKDSVNVEVPELKPEDTVLLVGTAVVADGQEVKLKVAESGGGK